MRDIKLGQNSIDRLNSGNKQIDNCYIGDNLVYNKACIFLNFSLSGLSSFDSEYNLIKTINPFSFIGSVKTDNNYIYVLGYNEIQEHRLRVYDRTLTLVKDIFINQKDQGNALVYRLIVKDKKVLYVVGVNDDTEVKRYGFIDFNKSDDIHPLSLKINGSSCPQLNIGYDYNENKFLDCRPNICYLNEDTFEWDYTDIVPYNNPCANTKRDVTTITYNGGTGIIDTVVDITVTPTYRFVEQCVAGNKVRRFYDDNSKDLYERYLKINDNLIFFFDINNAADKILRIGKVTNGNYLYVDETTLTVPTVLSYNVNYTGRVLNVSLIKNGTQILIPYVSVARYNTISFAIYDINSNSIVSNVDTTTKIITDKAAFIDLYFEANIINQLKNE